MIVERTLTPWTAAAVLFRHVYDFNPEVVYVSVERCSRSSRIGLIFKRLLHGDCKEIRRYLISPASDYRVAIRQIFTLEYGYFTNNSRNN